MTPEEFNKITVGSIVKLKSMPQFIGEVLKIDNKKDGYNLFVDFPPNNMTHDGDPEPMWMHFGSLDIVEIAKENIIIPDDIKVLIRQLDLNINILYKNISNVKAKYNI